MRAPEACLWARTIVESTLTVQSKRPIASDGHVLAPWVLCRFAGAQSLQHQTGFFSMKSIWTVRRSIRQKPLSRR